MMVNKFQNKFIKLIESCRCSTDDVHNADEMGVNCKSLPQKSLSVNCETASQRHITVMLSIMLVECISCYSLLSKNVTLLPVQYKAQRRSWMSSKNIYTH